MLGAGPTGRALAAWLLAEGTDEVTLFSVYSDELATLDSGTITLRGEGPVGTFRVGDGGISVTSVLDSAVADADVLFVTGPVFKLRTYGMVLAPHLGPDQTLVVPGGRTFGGLEVDWWLNVGGHRSSSILVELTGVPFDVREEGSTLHLERRRPVRAGVRPAHRGPSVGWLTDIFGDVSVGPTILHASFADASGLVEVPALTLGGPALGVDVETMPPGAVPLMASTFRALIAPAVFEMIDRLASERRAVAAHYGVRDLPTTDEWVEEVAGGDAPADARGVPTSEAALAAVREGVLGSLVPLASAGRLAGQPTPITDSLVATVSATLGADLAAAGRTLEGIGFAGSDPDSVRRAVGVTGGDGRGR